MRKTFSISLLYVSVHVADMLKSQRPNIFSPNQYCFEFFSTFYNRADADKCTLTIT